MPGDVLLARSAFVDPRDELGQFERRRQRRVGLRLHDREVLPDQGKLDDRLPEGGPFASELDRFQIRAPHQTARAERIQPARGVEHADGGLEALLERPERVPDGAFELDLAGRQRPRPQLVLQSPDAKATTLPRNEETADATCAGRRAARPCRHDELIRVGDRAEPLLAVEPPHLAVGHRLHAVRSNVRAPVALGEELRTALGTVVVGLEERRQESRAHVVGRAGLERAHEPGRADDRAGMSTFARMGEGVEERGLLACRGRHDPRGPDRPAGTMVGGVELDLAVVAEPRRMALGFGDRRIDHVPHDVREVMCYRR